MNYITKTRNVFPYFFTKNNFLLILHPDDTHDSGNFSAYNLYIKRALLHR